MTKKLAILWAASIFLSIGLTALITAAVVRFQQTQVADARLAAVRVAMDEAAKDRDATIAKMRATPDRPDPEHR